VATKAISCDLAKMLVWNFMILKYYIIKIFVDYLIPTFCAMKDANHVNVMPV